MYTLKFFILILFSIFFCKRTNAQTEVKFVSGSSTNHKIAISDILGTWYSMDSLNTVINFVYQGGDMIIDGIHDGVGNYTFNCDKDSLWANGYAVNWPPFDCTLNLLKNDVLEIKFHTVVSESVALRFFSRSH